MDDVFDNLDDLLILEDEISVSEKTNEEQSSEIQNTTVSYALGYEKTYPYVELLLNENSTMNSLTKDALEDLLKTEISAFKDGQDMINKQASYNILCVGVSNGEKSKVIGFFSKHQIRFFHSLVRNMQSTLYLSEEETYDGSNILALI